MGTGVDDYSDLPMETIFAERRIRPAVFLRKNGQSIRGTATQAVWMSAYRIVRLRGLNPTKINADALKTYNIKNLRAEEMFGPCDNWIPSDLA